MRPFVDLDRTARQSLTHFGIAAEGEQLHVDALQLPGARGGDVERQVRCRLDGDADAYRADFGLAGGSRAGERQCDPGCCNPAQRVRSRPGSLHGRYFAGGAGRTAVKLSALF
jgi:hypothetical protein